MTHGKKYQVSFSDKRHLYTQKPNVFKKNFYSEILNRKFKLNVSTKALKTILKKGGFDNYILQTKPEKMNSKYGMYLRGLMQRKLKDPEWDVGHVLFTTWHK